MRLIFGNSARIFGPERFFLRGGRWKRIALKVRFAVVIDNKGEPILIDTGYGPQVTRAPGRSGFLRVYNALFRPELIAEQSPENLLSALGFLPRDVKRVILTHFHVDHVAQLDLFPQAEFIACSKAWRQVKSSSSFANARKGVFRELFPDDFERRLKCKTGFSQVTAPLGLPPGYDLAGDGSILAIDLPGHAAGHFGICFPHFNPPLLYAADTQWLRAAIMQARAPRGFAQLIYDDAGQQDTSAERVRNFADEGGEFLLCHDGETSSFDFDPAQTQ